MSDILDALGLQSQSPVRLKDQNASALGAALGTTCRSPQSQQRVLPIIPGHVTAVCGRKSQESQERLRHSGPGYTSVMLSMESLAAILSPPVTHLGTSKALDNGNRHRRH